MSPCPPGSPFPSRMATEPQVSAYDCVGVSLASWPGYVAVWDTNDQPKLSARLAASAQDEASESPKWVQVGAVAWVIPVTRVPVAVMPSERRYGATTVPRGAIPLLSGTQLSAAPVSVRENSSVTYGPAVAGSPARPACPRMGGAAA